MAARRGAWIAVFNVIGRHLPAFRPRTIFDVGANGGETTTFFAERYPDAEVHAFEPVPASHAQLLKRTAANARIHAHGFALTDRDGPAWMEVPDNARLARIVPAQGGGPGLIEVDGTTGDAFCSAARISRVDLLKVDTEGHDLDVLRGFTGLLGRQRIGLIDIEVGMAPDNDRHVPLGAVRESLVGFGYQPFWLHELTLDTYFTGRPVLRRLNAVFISEEIVTANTTAPGRLARAGDAREDG